MSYDTKHVRNAGDTPGMITGFPTFAELLENPSLASLYTLIRGSATATGPELVETTTVSKKTVYDYLHKLEQAGLISKVGDDAGTAVYTAEEFELTLTVRETEVSITPELIEVIAQKNEYPAIKRVLEDHGIVTFALTYDLVNAHDLVKPISTAKLGQNAPRPGDSTLDSSQIYVDIGYKFKKSDKAILEICSAI